MYTLHILLQQHAILYLAPSQLHSSVNSPYYITMHMHAQTQLLNSAGQPMHTNTPLCILNMYFDTHLKRDPCLCVCGSAASFKIEYNYSHRITDT